MGTTAYVAKSCPVICRQELHEQRADLSGKAGVGRETVCVKLRQWQERRRLAVSEGGIIRKIAKSVSVE
jgi:hypothetical protein